MKHADSKRYRQRMLAGIKSKIRHYEKCLPKLKNLDSDVFTAGIELFEDADRFASWLCEPQPGLGGKIPLKMMRTDDGRRQVRRVLNAINHGVYL